MSRPENGGNTAWRCATGSKPEPVCSPTSLYMYLIAGLYSRMFGSPVRFTFRQHLSYHSMTPWSVSPSRSTKTIGVFACICFT